MNHLSLIVCLSTYLCLLLLSRETLVDGARVQPVLFATLVNLLCKPHLLASHVCQCGHDQSLNSLLSNNSHATGNAVENLNHRQNYSAVCGCFSIPGLHPSKAAFVARLCHSVLTRQSHFKGFFTCEMQSSFSRQ